MDPLVTSLTVPLRFVVGVLAAAVALFVMGLAIPRFPDGELPPQIAAGVLTNRRPDGISGNLADAIHYAAGLLGGPVFVWLTLLFEGLLGSASLVAAGLAMVVLYGFLTGFFLLVVLPRSRVADLRVPRIQRAWLFSVAIYVLVLAPLTAVGTALL
ncbi:hypothetical protein [Halolamina sp.]|jgi:hypothetical protein|uniref:hypothetical protein n=1 Tax=Halolamina sp. TaxID=1940283 RepID=UPI000223BEB7|nr:hypothetical protein Halar_3315 [halophilic archaeon DL31]